MKKFIIIGIVITFTVLFTIWFIFSSKTLPETPETNTIFPTTNLEQEVKQSSIAQPEIADALLGQIQNANLITLEGTIYTSTYALQTWGDENKGGEALLKYDSNRGWVLISMGGGKWNVTSLLEVGVPQSVAEQLIFGKN